MYHLDDLQISILVFFSVCRQDADITFILDGSGSIDQLNFDLMKEFVKDVIDELNVAEDRSHVALITFSDNANLNFDLQNKSDSRRTVKESIDDVS